MAIQIQESSVAQKPNKKQGLTSKKKRKIIKMEDVSDLIIWFACKKKTIFIILYMGGNLSKKRE